MKINVNAPSLLPSASAGKRQADPAAVADARAQPQAGGVNIDLSALRASFTVTLGGQQKKSDSPYSALLTTLSSLRQTSGGASPQRKAAARARVAQIKEQIEQMRKFATSLDPKSAKAMASQIRMLAQQLKAAAAELTGGSGGVVTVPPVNMGGSGTAAGGEAAGNQADEGANAAAAAEAAAAKADAAAAAFSATAAAAGADADAEGAGAEGGDESAAAEDADRPGRQGQQGGDQGAADRALVRDAAGKLKALLALVRAQLRNGRNDDTDKTDRAMAEIDKILADADKAAAGGAEAAISAAGGADVAVAAGSTAAAG